MVSNDGPVFLCGGDRSGIGLVYLLSTALCFFVARKYHKNWFRNTLLFAGISTTALGLGFGFKPQLLGIHVYFVPSASMSPALNPGQFILIDTWIYDRDKPLANDIVVFVEPGSSNVLVKRITPWPDGRMQDRQMWFVMGDNRNRSKDSRHFGGVPSDRLIGKVRMILGEIDQWFRIQPGSILRPVR